MHIAVRKFSLKDDLKPYWNKSSYENFLQEFLTMEAMQGIPANKTVPNTLNIWYRGTVRSRKAFVIY
jgi:hypothetical protein